MYYVCNYFVCTNVTISTSYLLSKIQLLSRTCFKIGAQPIEKAVYKYKRKSDLAY